MQLINAIRGLNELHLLYLRDSKVVVMNVVVVSALVGVLAMCLFTRWQVRIRLAITFHEIFGFNLSILVESDIGILDLWEIIDS